MAASADDIASKTFDYVIVGENRLVRFVDSLLS